MTKFNNIYFKIAFLELSGIMLTGVFLTVECLEGSADVSKATQRNIRISEMILVKLVQ